ncbi:MAG: peptidase dimerization domain-containing protein [Proteobacteria bacterium]|nr:peptidase dimerization domain-containing protein [Pseudomonadota bacterium]
MSAELDRVKFHFSPLKAAIEALFEAQWRDPEVPAMEYRSSARLQQFLKDHGFEVTAGIGGVPTAFEARLRLRSGPVVAILAEYDALPGLAAEAEASFKPVNAVAGHACGHNHIGPANSAAAILAVKAARDLKLAGEIRVIGCPAEEILWGKIALLHAGVFDGVDCILTSHGDYQTGSLSRPCQSVVMGEFVFKGEAGHAGFALSSNALLAAEQLVQRAETALAEAFPKVQRRHVLRRSGVMPGITPDETRVWYSTRALSFEDATAAYAMICELADTVGAERKQAVRHQFIAESRGYLGNDVLGTTLFEAMREVGPPAWQDADIAFMRELSATCAPDAEMKLDRGVHYFGSGEDYYGQDDGDLSWRIPLGRVNWAYPEQVPIHHWSWTSLSGHKASAAGPLMAAQTLALGAVRLLAAPERIAEAKAELVRRTAGVPLPLPRVGALKTLKTAPETFWNATWNEVTPI